MVHTNFLRKKSRLFGDFVRNVKAGDEKGIRDEIMRRCGISYMSYRKWIRGLSVPKQGNRAIINDVAQDFGYGSVFESD